MNIAIASEVRNHLLSAAAAAQPRECCGLLLGAPGRITRAVAAANVAADPTRSFEVDPAVLLATHRTSRDEGLRVLGHYHSHPNGRADPSPRDAARALADGQLWLIVAGDSITAWLAGATGLHGRFRPVALATG